MELKLLKKILSTIHMVKVGHVEAQLCCDFQETICTWLKLLPQASSRASKKCGWCFLLWLSW